MNLKARLSRLQTQTGATAPATPPATNLRQRLAQLRPERVQAATTPANAVMSEEALADHLDGERMADGVFRVCRRIPLTGDALGSGLAPSRATGDAFCLKNLSCSGEPPRLPGEPATVSRRHVYLDTETTGLSGGSGTLAFLIGVAVVEDAAIVLQQFLMTRFAAEADLLAAFADTLSPDDHLVSYNGKSYDLPLLVSRFRMQGLAHPFNDLPHLDLLYPVRRLFGRRWTDCRLMSLEANLLGFARVDDLPGSEAPAAWFDFIRSGRGGLLARVVSHNHQDILSLALAHRALSQAIEAPRRFDVDLHALARWLLETGEGDARALLESHAGALCPDGQRLLACLWRRAGRWPRAVAIWENLAASGCPDSLERLAKYHEHVSKDLAAAQDCCTRLPDTPARERRRQRIQAKIACQRNRATRPACGAMD
jgi:uncharacterized protein YprB with RNaseH-like and TPR domain